MSLDPSSPVGDLLGQPATPQGTAGHVAIVGCGPSGCYTALALRRAAPDVHITIFDTRPTPFGLLRYGVAPDHQGMKNVSRQFDRLFASDHVDFVGTTAIGGDLPLELLEEHFDVVVLATGLAADRPLEVPVDPAAPVHGAGQLLRFLNGDPDSTFRTSTPRPLGEEVLIVGTGNVAMDVARLLCKADDGFHNSDIDDEARDTLGTADLRHLTLLSRGPRDRVRWDASMFAELCALPGVTVYLDGQIDERSATSDTSGENGRDVRIDVRFREVPISVDADGQHCVVRTRLNTDLDAAGDESGTFVHRVDTVITAMGFVEGDAPRAWADRDRVVRVGGCGSGFLGNLAENRTLAKDAAREIADRLRTDAGRTGLDGLRPHLPPTSTTFDDWTVIDHAEVGRARPGRVRHKFTTWSDMADIITASKK
ncbi:FAD-dependent oxidoreductase [Rhodococcus sp. UNC23MFCrub1.1]|uniref:FAD-dependent oxidoreductase n=1 Tax=Rhodococcus sp. UNC23MFCrub1.1 TaxID=1449068 RepID=UPI0009E071F6|nr:FAD-dependent oxidoreductase [Rhodococcus sp. UNC23MFCrub1.1]